MSRLSNVGFAILLLTLTVSIGYSVPILAPPSPSCITVPGAVGTPTDTFIPFATWTSANFNCSQTDKIYSNFAEIGIPTDTFVEVTQQTIGGIDIHTVSFDGNFSASFNASYDIAIDMVMSPFARIVRVSGDLSNPSNLGAPTNTKNVFSEGGVLIGSLTTTVGNPGIPIVTSNTALHVVDGYSPVGGVAVSVSNTFAEVVPEPISSSMIGLGLIILSLKRRYSSK